MHELEFILNNPELFTVTFSVVMGLGFALVQYRDNGILATFFLFVTVAFFFESFFEYPKNYVMFSFYGAFFVAGLVLGGGLPRTSFISVRWWGFLDDLRSSRQARRQQGEAQQGEYSSGARHQNTTESAREQFRKARRECEPGRKEPAPGRRNDTDNSTKTNRKSQNSRHQQNQGSQKGNGERKSYQERLKRAGRLSSNDQNARAERERKRKQEQAREELNRARAEKKAEEEKQRQKQERQKQQQKTTRARTAMEVLGLQSGYTPDDLTKAYKQLRGRYHPDRFEHMSDTVKHEMAKEFQAVQEAYKKLK